MKSISLLIGSLLLCCSSQAFAQEALPETGGAQAVPVEISDEATVAAIFAAMEFLGQQSACTFALTGLELAEPGGALDDNCWAAYEACSLANDDFFSSGQCESLNYEHGCNLPCD